MRDALFRRQVAENHGERLWGELFISQPMSFRFLSCFLLLITLMAGVFLWLNDYPRKEQVSGVLTPDRGLIQLSPSRDGRVMSTHVNAGDRVEKNQTLITLRSDLLTGEKETLSNILIDRVRQQQDMVRERMQLEKDSIEQMHQLMKVRSSSLQQEVTNLQSLHSEAMELLDLKRRESNRVQTLYFRNLASETEFEAGKERLLEQQSAVGHLTLQLTERKNQLDTVQLQWRADRIQANKEILRIEEKLAELEQQLDHHLMDATHHIKSPIAGTIGHMSVYEGQQVRPGRNILGVVPENSRLQAELLIPSRAIGLVNVGQEIRIRYEAFPYQTFGLYTGTIDKVSDAATRFDSPAVRSGQYFRVTALLDGQSVHAYGREYPLKPGMEFKAELIIERRRLMEWLMDPLLSVQKRL